MLAYAANRPVVAQRGSAPNAMLAIIALHVAAIAALMSARMDLPARIIDDGPIDIDWIQPVKPPPPADPVRGPVRPQPGPTVSPTPTPMPPLSDPVLSADPPVADPIPTPGPSVTPMPAPAPTVLPVRSGPSLLTPPSELKPPYPASKLASGEEAVLRLNLTIDERGRVVAVEPIGRADRIFLEAARRHLLAHWRYKPASEDGRAVSSSIAVTLRFRLEA